MRCSQRITYGQTFKKSKSKRHLDKKFLIIVELLSNTKRKFTRKLKSHEKLFIRLTVCYKSVSSFIQNFKMFKCLTIGKDLTLAAIIYIAI